MKKIKKHYKKILIAFVIILIIVLGVFIYINLFKENASNRLENIENYELTKKEVTSVKETFEELENIKSIDVYTNYKIIKIYLELEEDIDFEKIKEKANKTLENFSEENLEYYDVEIFIESLDEESEVYPKIGYKYKTNSEFTWNR